MKEFLQKAWERITFIGGLSLAGVSLAVLGGTALDFVLNVLGENAGDWIENIKLGAHQKRDAYRVYKNLKDAPNGKGGEYILNIDDTEILTDEFFTLSTAVIKEMVLKKDEEATDLEEKVKKLGGGERLKSGEKKALTKIFTDYLFDTNIREYLTENSQIFRNMGIGAQDIPNAKKRRQDAFVKMLENARQDFLERCFWDLESDHKILISILQEQIVRDNIKESNEIREEIKKSEEKMISTLLSVFGRNALDNGGSVNFTELKAIEHSPKFMARRCPECGYAGERLIYNEKEESFHCCACGIDYSLMQNIEQEALIMQELSGVSANTNQIKAMINQLEANNREQSAKIMSAVAKVEIGAKENALELDKIDEGVMRLGESLDGIGKRVEELAEKTLKKEYFEAMAKKQSEDMTSVISAVAEKVQKTVISQANATYESISTEIENNQKSLIGKFDLLEKKINESEENLIFEIRLTSQKIDTVNENVLKVYDEIRFLSDYTDEINRKVLEKFDKFEEMISKVESKLTDDLGEVFDLGHSFNSFSQPVAKKIAERTLRAIKEGKDLGDDNFTVILVDIIDDIKSIRENTEKTAKAIGGSVDIPKNLLLIDTDGGVARCPFCGVEGAHGQVKSDASYYKCSVCKNQFLNVNKLNVTERACPDKTVRDKILEFKSKVEMWKEAHTSFLLQFESDLEDVKNAYRIVLEHGIDDGIVIIDLDKRMRQVGTQKRELDTVHRINKVEAISNYQHTLAKATKVIFYSSRVRELEISGEFLTGEKGQPVKYKCYTYKGIIK